MDFVDNDIGWTAGTSGLIMGSTDGGQTWEETGTHHAYGQVVTYCSICFPTIEQGYACGYLKPSDYNMRNWASTEDGGETWSWPTSWSFPAGRWHSVFFLLMIV